MASLRCRNRACSKSPGPSRPRSGRVGAEFATALEERARAGVQVDVILDWAGSDAMWKNRPWTQKFAELVIRPIRSQL